MKQLIVAIGLSALFAWWLTPGWWNFGFGVIGVLTWIYVMWQYPIIRKSWYLQILAFSNLLLMLLMWQRNNGAIKVMSFWGWGISLGTILALATEPKEIITWKRVWNTFLQGVGYLFTGWVSVITLGKRFGSVITGLLLAVPLLLLFGWLFYMADPTFAMLIDQSGFFKVKINDLFWTNLFVTFVFFSGIYSLLRTKLVKTVVVV